MRIKISHWIAFLSFGLITAAQADITVEPAGMKVVWKSLDKEFDGFKTYNSSEGVGLTLVAKSTEKQFIGFNKKTSKLTFMDGETDLGGKFGFFDKISKDGRVMKVELNSKKLPAKGVASIGVKGTLDVIVASKSETKTLGPREFKKDDKLELGEDFKFTVKSIGKPKWGDNALEVTFEWKRTTPGKVEELKEVRFYGEDGKLIESSRGGTSWGGFGTNYSTSISYNLKKEAKILKVEMDIWTDAERVTVPLNLALKIGG
ncbi:MAG: hypothetical protein AB8F34_14740 [Akkermansiaceae bacterium]